MIRTILHLDLDTFFVSCERLLNPNLNSIPVIIGGITGRGTVASCSYEARQFGVHSNMPMKLAKTLCPDAVIIRGNSGFYGKFSRIVSDIIKEEAPSFEKASFDEFYIDLTGMDKFFGSLQWAKELKERIIKESGLPLSIGMSINKTVSKVGTNQAKPDGFLQVEYGTEKDFLSPLSVMEIPGVGKETFYKLREMGVWKVKTIQEMPKKFMRSSFGEHGLSIWNKCNAIDPSPIIQYHERKSIGLERTFERDTIDIKKMTSLMIAMAENLALQLRNGNKLTSIVTVRIRYADLSVFSKQKRVDYTSNDHVLIEVVKELFQRLYERRLRIRLIGVRYAGLVGGGHQINLLDDTEEMCNLYQAMDRMRNKYGQDAVKRAIAVGSNHIGRLNPFNGEPPHIPAHRRA
ncbi:MAG: DNA polymerase IV [Cyclobacteriaceae bacterium]|nr:DNA polymerase IV [Cyclobacteriaceae bacterium HetDA_MAG_MS6]